MLWKWRTKQENYRDSGYDVLAITPTFAARIGWSDANMTVPYWGKGTGQLTVDYRDTSQDFWALVEQHRPIAIMSFSRGFNDKSWELEAAARNLQRTQWAISLNYLDNGGTPQTETWERPHAGGSAADFSPYQGDGAIAGDPPDRSQAAGQQRASNLPMAAIRNAVNNHFPNPPGNIVAAIDNTGDVGAFVSEYMAYHVGWYRDYVNATFPNDDSKKCLFAGHTHVGVQVSAANGETAVDLQLDELFKVLP